MTIKVMVSRRTENCGFLCSCSSWCDGKAFLGRVHRYTARVPPPKEWRGRRELAPRCSATRISCIARTRLDRHAVSLIIRTTHTTHTHTPHTHHTHTHPQPHTHHTHTTHTTHHTGFKQVLSTPAAAVHKSLLVAIHFLWSPSWHRNLRKARARARARLRFSVPEEFSICVHFSGCGIITAVHHQ